MEKINSYFLMSLFKEALICVFSMRQTIALFGEAEKGELTTLLFITSLVQLNDKLGNPPEESRGIDFAVQFLLCECNLIYIRVNEEGFSSHNYSKGIQLLVNNKQIPKLSALCLPGVGNEKILDAAELVCRMHQALMITTEKDLYDYLTSISHCP